MNIPVITPVFGAIIGWMYKYVCFENYIFTLFVFATGAVFETYGSSPKTGTLLEQPAIKSAKIATKTYLIFYPFLKILA